MSELAESVEQLIASYQFPNRWRVAVEKARLAILSEEERGSRPDWVRSGMVWRCGVCGKMRAKSKGDPV